MNNIQTRWPDAEIVGFSMNPEDTLARHGIRSYPIRALTWKFGHKRGKNDDRVTFTDKVKIAVSGYRFLSRLLAVIYAVAIGLPRTVCQEVVFLVKSFRFLRSFDLLIISGGGQLVESSGGAWTFLGGPWKFPYTIFKWASLAKLARVKTIVLNVGAGPLVSPLGKGFVRGALSLADYISFRDEQSRALVQHIGFHGRTHVFPDSAYSRDVSALRTRRIGRRSDMVVGLAPMAYGDPRLSPKHDPALYDSFIRKLGLFGSWLISNHYCVTLFCTDIGIDPPAVVDVEKIVRTYADMRNGNSHSVSRVHQWSIEELLSNMSAMDYVVTSRFHAVVFAHMLNKPVLAISNHVKVTTLMNELGLSKYCVDVQKCDSDVLAETFVSLVSNRDEIKNRMAEKLAAYREKLLTQFDELFPYEARRNVRKVSSLVGPLVVGLASLLNCGGAGDSVLGDYLARLVEMC